MAALAASYHLQVATEAFASITKMQVQKIQLDINRNDSVCLKV